MTNAEIMELIKAQVDALYSLVPLLEKIHDARDIDISLDAKNDLREYLMAFVLQLIASDGYINSKEVKLYNTLFNERYSKKT